MWGFGFVIEFMWGFSYINQTSYEFFPWLFQSNRNAELKTHDK